MTTQQPAPLPTTRPRTIARLVLAGAMVFAGLSHLFWAREEFQAQVPEAVPMDPDGVVMSPVDLLEIGVQNGGSLELWARYFRRGKTFVGCDIDERCANLTFADPRIRVVVGDATTAQAEARIAEQCPGFDIVIDDGSHRAGDMLSAFARYFELLKPGGVYCIEDAHTLYWQHFDDDRLLQLRARRFFRALADAVNYQHWRDAGAPEGPLAETSADTPWPDAVKQGWVDAVEFRNSLIFIRKAMHPGHDKLGTRLISGTRAVVDPQPLALRSAPADGEVSPSPQRSPVV